jgi:alpha-L-fucosidase
LNESYPVPILDTANYTSSKTGLLYSFPGYTGSNAPDNVVCSGEVVDVPVESYFSASFLIAGDLASGSVSANVTFMYTDNTTSVVELLSQNWWSFLTISRGEIILPSRFTSNNTNYNTTHIFERNAALNPGKQLSSIILPQTTNVTEGRLHLFAVSLWQGSSVEVQSVRPTQKWLGNGEQAVEVTLNNAGAECVSGDGLTVSINGEGFTTTTVGHVKRLCPGDQKIATVGITGSSNGSVSADVIIKNGCKQSVVHFDELQFGLTNWTSDLDSLAQHESPEWFDSAKFGIFIHWGPYSVTGMLHFATPLFSSVISHY